MEKSKTKINIFILLFVIFIFIIVLVIGTKITKIGELQNEILEYEEIRLQEAINNTNNAIMQVQIGIINEIKQGILVNGYINIPVGNNQSLVLVQYRGNPSE